MEERIRQLEERIKLLENPKELSRDFINLLLSNGFMQLEKRIRFDSDALIEYYYAFIRHGVDANNKLLFTANPVEYVKEIKSVNTSSNRIESPLHGLADDMQIRFISTGSLPSPLVQNQPYYVIDENTNSFKVSNTMAGPEVNITNQGIGVHYWSYIT